VFVRLCVCLVFTITLGAATHLRAFDGSPGNSLTDVISWRNGARSQVSRKRPNTHRKATADEVSEHGRWRIFSMDHRRPLAFMQLCMYPTCAMVLSGGYFGSWYMLLSWGER
jgi:hypothetical protein